MLPGQDPFNVWVGWVTPDFHQHGPAFDPDRTRTVTVTLGDDSGKVQERSVRGKFFNHRRGGICDVEDCTELWMSLEVRLGRRSNFFTLSHLSDVTDHHTR